MFGKILFLAFSIFVLCGCHGVKLTEKSFLEIDGLPTNFVAVFDDGCKMDVYGSSELATAQFPPCSTFKILSTPMGLDCGIVHDLNSQLGYDGTKYENPNWNKDVTLQEAFQTSCVPFYKKMTGRFDNKYVQKMLRKLQYGNCNISVWNSNGHNVFWIESSLLISPLEQINVIKKIFSDSSPFSPEHVALLKACMKNTTVGERTVYGKTGTGRNHNSNFLEAWFVGFAENADGEKIYFAAHGAAPERNVSSPEIRDAVKKILNTIP